MSDYLVVLGVAVGLLVGYGIGRVMTTAAYLDRLAEQPGQVGNPHALDQAIVARVSGTPPRPRPVPATEVIALDTTVPAGIPLDATVSNADAGRLFPDQCDGVRLCAAHTPHLCRREGPCCSRCPCS